MYKGLTRDFTVAKWQSNAAIDYLLFSLKGMSEEKGIAALEKYEKHAKRSVLLAHHYAEEHESWDDDSAVPTKQKKRNNNKRRKKSIEARMRKAEKKIIRSMEQYGITQLEAMRLCRRMLVRFEELK